MTHRRVKVRELIRPNGKVLNNLTELEAVEIINSHKTYLDAARYFGISPGGCTTLIKHLKEKGHPIRVRELKAVEPADTKKKRVAMLGSHPLADAIRSVKDGNSAIEVANACGVSRQAVYQAFKRVVGVQINNYRQKAGK